MFSHFLKNNYKVQQPVILPHINENQNSWHTHIFNTHTNIQKNKRLLTQKLWEDLAKQMTYPICNIYYQIKGQNSSKRGQIGMKFYHSLEILTNNKLQNKFQLDMFKGMEIISRKPRMDGLDVWMDRQTETRQDRHTDITLP
jgi:hypothetical protein